MCLHVKAGDRRFRIGNVGCHVCVQHDPTTNEGIGQIGLVAGEPRLPSREPGATEVAMPTAFQTLDMVCPYWNSPYNLQ
jgi:hypothetical protein